MLWVFDFLCRRRLFFNVTFILMMIRNIMFILSMLFFTLCLYGQKVESHYQFRSYNASLVLTLGGDHMTAASYDSYGNLVENRTKNEVSGAYLFQSQEYDHELQLYLFPSRFYSLKRSRFISPDPKSQYASPYLFVGADPINIVDRDGKKGMPIVFYSEEHESVLGMSQSMFDFMNEVRDAYFIPLSEFMNGEVGDVPEWNGNVFIKGHMSPHSSTEMEVERSVSENKMKASAYNMGYFDRDEEGVLKTFTDAEVFGRTLRRFSEERGVPVKRIVAGGCEGGTAAERIGMGYASGGERFMGRELITTGLKPEMNALISGRLVTTKPGKRIGLERTRFHVRPQNAEIFSAIDHEDFGNGVVQQKFSNYSGSIKGGPLFELNYGEGKELRRMANGRIPRSIKPHFEEFKFTY